MIAPNMILVLIISFLSAAALGTCPPKEDISPCICISLQDGDQQDFAVLKCRGMRSEELLESVIRASRDYHVFELEISYSRLRHLPLMDFVGTHFEVISIHNSSIATLSESSFVFPGLEDSLHLVEVINCTFAEYWNWSQFAHLDKLMEVHLSDSGQLHVTKGISSIAHLYIDSFAFQKNQIAHLDEDAFAPFQHVTRIALDHNSIEEVQRSMFPRSAKQLKILGLSYNLLQSLPDDLFQGMPALRSLYLTGNPMHTMDETVFSRVWNQLGLILFSGTPLKCDCKLIWLAKFDNRQKHINAECREPQALQGRNLSSILIEELRC